MNTRLDEMAAATTAYHNAHPEVWKFFDEFTKNRIAKGFKHYSVNAIFERIRWESDIGADGKVEFKIGNNFRAFYARAWMDLNPEYSGFFRTRKQTSENAPATGKPEKTPEDYQYE